MALAPAGRVRLLLGLVAFSFVGCAAVDPPVEGQSSSDLTSCPPMPPSCDGPGGPTIERHGFDHFKSNLAARLGGKNHRARDLVTTVGEPQWILAKMAYGLADKDLEDETVEIFVQRGCAGAWDSLGTTKTGSEGSHPAVDGVSDGGGRVFFRIPENKTLPAGRHRVRLVVRGDGTSADALVDILPKSSPIVVSDVDGTLTSSENAEFPALLTGRLPDARPDAAAVLQGLAKKGYRVVYLTARAERLGDRTRAFLSTNGFPEGAIHTSTSALGLNGDAAASFKSDELQRLRAHGLNLAWGLGNTATDAQAYAAAGIPANHRLFLQLADTHGGRRLERYADELPEVTGISAVCK